MTIMLHCITIESINNHSKQLQKEIQNTSARLLFKIEVL